VSYLTRSKSGVNKEQDFYLYQYILYIVDESYHPGK